jgi:uncharacterized membrane protein YccC
MTTQLTARLGAHPMELRLCLRILAAGMLAFFIADDLLGLPQSYWAVLTPVIVMQASIGVHLRHRSTALSAPSPARALGDG